MASALPQFVCSATLGEADTRSFAGQPLDVRIPIQAGRNEWIDLSCISVRAGDRALSPLPTSRFRLDESLDSRTLVVRTHDPVAGPSLTLELAVRCEGQAAPVARTYELNLPVLNPVAPEATLITIQKPGEAPRTITAQAAQTAFAISPTPAPAGKQGSVWTTGTGDTLDGIAKGLYPKSSRMRAAFIKQLRDINPGPLPGDGDLLATGLKLTLPNLVALANQSPRIDPKGDSASAVARSPSKAAPTTVATVTPPAKPSAPAAPRPAPVAPKRASESAPPKSIPDKTASLPKGGQGSGGFTLRLSGTEMDLSRSRGVTEATRAALRDKQLMLDADDQVAALLALRHTVKQLEGRLNDMQLKLTTGALPVAAPAAAPVTKPAPAPEPQVVQKAAPQPPAPVPAAAPPAPAPAAETAPAKPAPQSSTPSPAGKSTAAASATSQAPVPEPEAESSWWTSPIFLGIAGVLLMVLGWVGWRWATRNRGLPPMLSESLDSSAVSSRDSATSDLQGPPSDRLPKDEWDDDDTTSTAQNSGFRSRPPSRNLKKALREAEHHETVRLHAPPELMDASAAALELDTRPATSVDFVLGEDFGEDKSRRQRYMEERFPELAHHSISVDDPDSIIDAARHHYEEGQLQKAIELLTYAFEERPGQLRFWLALFEIHRLEQRATDFAELASRFKNVHGGTDAWPKVQHIGRDLDPGQPLYSAALGRMGMSMDTDFDPMSENWLNVPMDFTSDVLMIELRQSLMAEHRVLEDEFTRPLIGSVA